MCAKNRLALLTTAIFVGAIAAVPLASAAPPEDACKLLTQAQVSAVLGVSMGAGSHVTPTYLKTCTWTPADGGTKNRKTVTISFQSADSFGAAKKLMEQSQAMLKAEGDKGAGQFANASASGIGDDAFYTSMGGNYTALLVKKRNTSFKVAIYGPLPVDEAKAMEKTLALEALSTL
jgi:hypothetical protein